MIFSPYDYHGVFQEGEKKQAENGCTLLVNITSRQMYQYLLGGKFLSIQYFEWAVSVLHLLVGNKLATL